MFNPGESTIKLEFKRILSDFCPRYFRLLNTFTDRVDEIRIEGHTSDEWKGLPLERAYFKNMELSQDRTRAVLQYCVDIEQSNSLRAWARKHITANGLSSSRPLCQDKSVKCRVLNRRVNFRVQVKRDL